MKKLTIEFIRKEFAKEGYELLTKVYENAHQRLEYICPRGHRHKVCWSDWNSKKKHRCPYCNNTDSPTIEFIRAEFAKEDYTLLTEVYEGSKQKLEYICPRKNRHSITWSHWNCSGNRCPCCSNVKKPTIEFIKSEFAKEDYILLTKVYENNRQKLEYICPRGHEYYVTWGNWQQKRRCPCFAGRSPITIDFVRNEFKKRGYTLLSTEYLNAHSKLKYRCPLEHVDSMSWDNFSHNQDCPICAKEKNKGSGHWNWKGGISKEPYCQNWTKELKEFIKERDGYKCMNPYCFQKKGCSSQLTIHHIDYNKKNCDPSNLITVCRGCNCRANTDRSWHEFWYKAIMYRRYDYKY